MSTPLSNPQPIMFTPGGLAPATVPARARIAIGLLRKIEHGALRLVYPDGQAETFGDGLHPVTLTLHGWQALHAAIRSGDIGFAESYIEGHWDTDNLPGLLELLARNRDVIDEAVYGTWWGGLLYRVRHLFNRNSKSGSRKNIHAHYDIGNAFYKLWLDPSMTYSSALFSDTAQSLQDAQAAKYRRILDQLAVGRDARILEIGCGWGGFAEVAARDGAAYVTGLTLSTEQLEYARQRLEEAQLSDRVSLKLQDYRDTDGQYDAIASIEMFEAVGEAYWPGYFECLHRNLAAKGRACIQTIVIADDLFARYRRGTDFIQQYIFPGGMLPSPSEFRRQAQKHGFRVVDELEFGLDYARTLAQWRMMFKEQSPQVLMQGFDEPFSRTWDFYLAYCEAGFRAQNIGVMHFTLEKQ